MLLDPRLQHLPSGPGWKQGIKGAHHGSQTLELWRR